MQNKYSFRNTDFVILAGGKGTRIKKLLGKYPKPMLKFNNKHFVQYILNKISKYNFKRIIILCSYRHEIFFKKYHKKIINFSEIVCIRETKLLGTAGALINLKKLQVNNFFLTNGDTIFDIDLKLLTSGLDDNKIGIIALTDNKNQKSEKLNSLILKKNEIKIGKKSQYMNGGLYFFKKNIFKYIKKNLSLENELLPFLIAKNKISGKIFKDFFLDIGSKKYINFAGKKLKEKFKHPAVFLDRDGVINYDNNYVHKFKDFKFRPGVLKGLEYLTKKKYYLFIVTNQAGIGKKIFSEKSFFFLHKQIKEQLAKKNIYINDVQYSPFHPEAKIKRFKKVSSLRKPGNRMIENIKSSWDLNFKKSFMIGDKITDEKAAKKSNLKFFYSERNFFLQIKKITNNY